MTWALKSLHIYIYIYIYILFKLKRYRGVLSFKVKKDTKFGEESTCSFKIGKFWPEHSKVSNIFTLMGSSWAKYIYTVWAKKVQRSYFSWNWRWITKFGEESTVISKLVNEIWQVLTWALKNPKNIHFKGLLLSKVYCLS